MAFIENAMKMFASFYPGGAPGAPGVFIPAPSPDAAPTDPESLKAQLDRLQKQVEQLSQKQ